jgi:hypothetical protein
LALDRPLAGRTENEARNDGQLIFIPLLVRIPAWVYFKKFSSTEFEKGIIGRGTLIEKKHADKYS